MGIETARSRIFVAYTGGTVGMKKTGHGYEPWPGHLEELLEAIPRFSAAEVPDFVIGEFDPLLDSSDMTPADWYRIAAAIRDRYDDFDGFLVLHGTDTMAYSASALSFMLEGLAKPVILTGSQIPLAETRNDAQDNLLTSLILLGKYHERLPGVFVFLDNRLFRGNRTTKVNADAFAAVASPNFPAVGKVGIDVEIDWDLVEPGVVEPQVATDLEERGIGDDGESPAAGLRVVEIGHATVSAFRLFPGLKAEYLRSLLAEPVQGVVLECYGAGNAPSRNEEFLGALSTANGRGAVIVAVTQALQGTADLSLYATGQALQRAGVVSGYDMTSEAALAKLLYLFDKGYPPDQVKTLVQQNLCGELTPPEDAPAKLQKLHRRLADFSGSRGG